MCFQQRRYQTPSFQLNCRVPISFGWNVSLSRTAPRCTCSIKALIHQVSSESKLESEILMGEIIASFDVTVVVVRTPLMSNKIINFHPWSGLTTKWTIGGLHLCPVWKPPQPLGVYGRWNTTIERQWAGSPNTHPKHTRDTACGDSHWAKIPDQMTACHSRLLRVVQPVTSNTRTLPSNA